MLAELSIVEFADRLSSEQPAPGGGSAAALSGLTGVCLLEMVINLSLGRDELAQHSELLTAKQTELARLHRDLQILIDRDAEAFSGVMTAYKLPKATEDEKQLRKDAVQKAYRQAAQIPLEVARACLDSLEIGKALCGKVNPHAVSDLAVGALSAHAAAIGALLNTAINLPFIIDTGLTSELDGQVYQLRSSADELLKEIQSGVYVDPVFAALRPTCG
jgi:formiminotetrahydrofolate cyclodeaminase